MDETAVVLENIDLGQKQETRFLGDIIVMNGSGPWF